VTVMSNVIKFHQARLSRLRGQLSDQMLQEARRARERWAATPAEGANGIADLWPAGNCC
jgi:hypothetical protein